MRMIFVLFVLVITACSESDPPAINSDYELTMTFPTPEANLAGADSVSMRGKFTRISQGTDVAAIDYITVNGAPVSFSPSDGTWQLELSLRAGRNQIDARIHLNDGSIVQLSTHLDNHPPISTALAVGATPDGGELLAYDDKLNQVVSVNTTTGEHRLILENVVPETEPDARAATFDASGTTLYVIHGDTYGSGFDTLRYQELLAVNLADGAVRRISNPLSGDGPEIFFISTYDPAHLFHDKLNNRVFLIDYETSVITASSDPTQVGVRNTHLQLMSIDLSTGNRHLLIDIDNNELIFDSLPTFILGCDGNLLVQDTLVDRNVVPYVSVDQLHQIDTSTGAISLLGNIDTEGSLRAITTDCNSNRLITVEYSLDAIGMSVEEALAIGGYDSGLLLDVDKIVSRDVKGNILSVIAERETPWSELLDPDSDHASFFSDLFFYTPATGVAIFADTYVDQIVRYGTRTESAAVSVKDDGVFRRGFQPSGIWNKSAGVHPQLLLVSQFGDTTIGVDTHKLEVSTSRIDTNWLYDLYKSLSFHSVVYDKDSDILLSYINSSYDAATDINLLVEHRLTSGTGHTISDFLDNNGPVVSRECAMLLDEAGDRVLFIDDDLDTIIAVDRHTGDRSAIFDLSVLSTYYDYDCPAVYDDVSGHLYIIDGRDRLHKIDLANQMHSILSEALYDLSGSLSISNIRMSDDGKYIYGAENTLGLIYQIDTTDGRMTIVAEYRSENGLDLLNVNDLLFDVANRRIFAYDRDYASLVLIDMDSGDRAIMLE